MRCCKGSPWPNHCVKAIPRVRKQKIGPNCNFFAIGNCCEPPNRESRHKNAGNLPCEGPFFALRGQGRVRNRKKVAEMPRFCFHDGWIAPTGRFRDGWIASTGGYRNGRITATGQITQMCVFSVAARVATSRATDRTKRPPCLAGLGWAAARVQRGLLRIGRSGSP